MTADCRIIHHIRREKDKEKKLTHTSFLPFCGRYFLFRMMFLMLLVMLSVTTSTMVGMFVMAAMMMMTMFLMFIMMVMIQCERRVGEWRLVQG